VKADVAIVDGGFAGLWAAVVLTEREPGIRIVPLEQGIVDGGGRRASGTETG